MTIIVIKRDGRKVPFNPNKINQAISKACKDISINVKNITNKVVSLITKNEISVEEIQDLVEKVLVENNYFNTAKAYILYRDERNKVRDINSSLNKIINNLVNLESTDLDTKRENANIDGNAPMGIMLQFGSEIAKKFSLTNLIRPEQVQAYKEGLIHIHDLNMYPLTWNCCQIPAGKLLEHGFSTGHGYIRQPNSIQTAAALMCIILQSNQNSMFGGQSIPLFEYDLAPYIVKSFITNILELVEYEQIDINKQELKDKLEKIYKEQNTLISINSINGINDKILQEAKKLTEKQCYQAMEALIHNLNTMQSRAGAQVPFSSINYGTGTTSEQRLIIKSILKATDAGLGNGETPIFPVQIFKVKDGVNTSKKDPNYDLFQLACKVSAKRLFPNFSFIDAPYNLQYYKKNHPETEIAVMGCFSKGHWIKIINTNTFNVSNVEISDFIENYNYKSYRVWDSLSGSYVEILNVINNPPTRNFYQVKYGDNYVVIVTEDHFFPLAYKGRTNVKDLKEGDLLYLSTKVKTTEQAVTRVHSVKPLPLEAKSYCLETASDRFDVNNIVSNNCRTRVIGNTYDPKHETPVGRGNIAFTTINLPRVALLSNHDLTAFYKELTYALNLCYQNLIDRFNFLAKKHAYNFPFLLSEEVWLGSENLEAEDTIKEILKQGTLAIGFCGLAECLKALIGKHHGESEEAQKLGLEIITFMKNYCDKKAEETKLTISLFATPAESTAGRFAKLNQKDFGIIKGVTDRDYITNGNHIPVYFPISVARKIELEAPYHALCLGGNICYVEANGDLTKNIEAFENVIQYMKKCGITYGSINHPVDRCPVCGYTGIINDICPKCGRHDGEAVSVEKLRAIGCNC